MKCPICQFENPEGAKYCNECSCRLAYPSESTTTRKAGGLDFTAADAKNEFDLSENALDLETSEINVN